MKMFFGKYFKAKLKAGEIILKKCRKQTFGLSLIIDTFWR